MARSAIPSRRMLFSSLGLLAGALLSAGALTACGAPTPTTPGLFVPAATSIDPASAADTDVMDTGSMTMTMTTPTPTPTMPVVAKTTTPAHTATHAVPARKTSTHTATTHTTTTHPAATRTTKKRPATVHTTKKAAPPTHSTAACSANYYRNSSGNCVHRPVSAPSGPPAGATAKCNDGTYSFSQHHSGTCSGHHGVAEWL
jgi:Protein of unknown function (DUF3761)